MRACTKLQLKLTALVLVFALSFLTTSAFSTELSTKRKQLNDVKSKLDQTRQKIKQAKTQESQLVSQIELVDEKMVSVQKEYDRLDNELQQVSREREVTENQLGVLQVELWNTQQELSQAEAKLAERREVLNNRIRIIYKRGNATYLELILNASDFVDFLSRVRFVGYILSQDAEIIRQVEVARAAIEVKKLEVEKEKAAVNAERLKLIEQEQRIRELTKAKLAQKLALEAEIDKKQSLLEQIKADRAAYELAEDQLLEVSANLTARIRQLEQELKAKGKLVGNSSGFVWPTEGPVTSPFGMRMHPILHTMRMHTGIDIGAPYGQAIVAVQDGVVLQAGWIKGYGQTVIISHGNGITTLYAHQSAILVSEGQQVSQGSTIGRVGSTGLSTGPHLHFEVRKDGEPQDPMKWY